MTSKDTYVFSGQAEDRELERLRLVEEAFDPATRRLLSNMETDTGARCLEVAAGGGSIARWMGERVGRGGAVTAVDLKPAYLGDLDTELYRVVEGDAASVDLGSGYDIAHCRYMLVHHLRPEDVLANVHTSIREGGRVLFEEPDWSVSRPLQGCADGTHRVHDVIRFWFENEGLDASFGSKLPNLAKQAGFRVEDVEAECHLCVGGSPVARVMAASIEALSDRYLATGRVSEADLASYVKDAGDPELWTLYYMTVRVIGKKTESEGG